jgi:hypothetical protein
MADDSSSAGSPPAAEVPKVTWDDTQMATSYANVVNAASTREEVALFFGTNQTWNLAKDREVTVNLTNRIILNPYAAKRLNTLLTGILAEYEKRHGTLESGSAG